MNKIDLHTHTTCSDGELSPSELVDRASKFGVSVLSITDHDTLAAYETNVHDYALSRGVELIPGVEISCEDTEGTKLHILGHFIDPKNERIQSWLQELRDRRREFAALSVSKLTTIGWSIDTGSLFSLDIISKAHIAQSVLSNSANKGMIEKLFGSTPSRGKFIETVMNKGCPGYVPRVAAPTPEAAIHEIQQAGGVSSLAHPVASIFEQKLTLNDIKDAALKYGFDGIEAIYYYFSKSNDDRRIDMVEDFIRIAKNLGLVAVGGSDFHGQSTRIGNYIEIGMTNEPICVSQEAVDYLRSLAHERLSNLY